MIKKAFYILLLLTLAGGLLGCAGADRKKVEAGKTPAPEIQAVSVKDNAVELAVTGNYTYTVYKPSDPYTVAIDLPGVGVAEDVASKITSERTGIFEVTITRTSTPVATTRVGILLETPSDVTAQKMNGTLLVSITPKVAEAEFEPVAPTPATEPAPAAAEEALPPATEINHVGFDYSDGTLKLVIKGNGAMTPEVFTLKKRIVIDVPGVSMAARMPAAVVTPVKGIRYGIHDGKVRMVIDLKDHVKFMTSTVADKVLITLPVEEVLEIQTAEVEAPTAPSPGGPAPVDEEGPKYTGKIISLDFQNANIVPIFRFIGDIAGYNVVLHPSVSGTVTLKLMNVPWDQALDIILNTFNLARKIEGNIMTIAPASVFQNIAKTKSKTKQTETVTAELIREEVALKYIEGKKLQTYLGSEKVMSPRGRMMIDERRNLLVIWDTEASMKAIKKSIRAWDIPEQREMQILIEAKIVEVKVDSARSLGIKWGGDFSANSPDITGDFSLNTPPTTAGATATVQGGAINMVLGAVDTVQITLSLEALETIGDLKKLANPRVLTIEGQEATIQQGVQIPVSSTSAEGSTTEFKDANLNLTVTPTVRPNGVIQLNVQANNDTPSSSVSGGIDKQSVKTNALVKDGQTLVLGGIYTDTKTVNETGVPVLMKIPLLGWMFKTQSTTLATTELLILITPTIIKDDTEMKDFTGMKDGYGY